MHTSGPTLTDQVLLLRFRDLHDYDALVAFIFRRHYQELRAVAGHLITVPRRDSTRDNDISEAIDDFFFHLDTPTSKGTHRLQNYDGHSDALLYIKSALRNFITRRLATDSELEAMTVRPDSGNTAELKGDGGDDAQADGLPVAADTADRESKEFYYVRLASLLDMTVHEMTPLRRYVYLTTLEDKHSRPAGSPPSRIEDKMALQLGLPFDLVHNELSAARRQAKAFLEGFDDTSGQPARGRGKRKK